MTIRLIRLFPFVLAAVLAGCTSRQGQDLPVGWPGSYLAHLQLDRTVLVATTIADSLEAPWEVAWGSDNRLWFTEQSGAVHRLDPETGADRIMLRVPGVHYQKSRGLLGMALYPDLEEQPYIFLHYTFLIPDPGQDKQIRSRLVRYTLRGDTLLEPRVLLDSIPGATYHNGSRIVVRPDGTLFLSTGDAGDTQGAQPPHTLSGKILRLTIDGDIPAGNPIAGSPVWSWGHRNAQGLVWARDRLYASEHGPSNDDEVNRIRPGGNYGWPNVHGFCDRENEAAYCRDSTIIEPLRAWTPTVAAAGLDYYDHPAVPEWRGGLLLVNLKGQALRVLTLNDDGEAVIGERIYFQQQFGRLRDLCVSPAGDLYLTTSNRDWHPRFQPFLYDTATLIRPGDDRIIRLRPAAPALLTALGRLSHSRELREDPEAAPMQDENWGLPAAEGSLTAGERLYQQQCATCHRPDGSGVPGQIPPLAGVDWVTGSKDRLIALTLRGLAAPIDVNGTVYDQEMPGFLPLDDEELAAILTFIRQSWGNQAGPVYPPEVAEERRTIPPKPAEAVQ